MFLIIIFVRYIQAIGFLIRVLLSLSWLRSVQIILLLIDFFKGRKSWTNLALISHHIFSNWYFKILILIFSYAGIVRLVAAVMSSQIPSFSFFQTNGMACLLSPGVFSCSGLLKTMCKTISLICAPSTLTIAKKGNKFIADGCVNVFWSFVFFKYDKMF